MSDIRVCLQVMQAAAEQEVPYIFWLTQLKESVISAQEEGMEETPQAQAKEEVLVLVEG